MNRLAIGLLLCVGGAAWASDNLFTANDHRIAIEVTARERNQILYEMREFLHGLHNIHHAMARGDMKAVALETKPMGETLSRIPANVRDRLPEGFMQMSIAMQEAFVALEKKAGGNGDSQAVQTQMAEIMTYCSGCHDTYRFEIVAYKANRRPTVDKVNPYTPQ
ncbi:MAG: cytochrome c [Thiobacillus sp.]|nr:cytochrome c [Thiobacillus sp.]